MYIVWTRPDVSVFVTGVANQSINSATVLANQLLASGSPYQGCSFAIDTTSKSQQDLLSKYPGFAPSKKQQILSQIQALENSVTPRMIQEALANVSTPIPELNNQTSAQYIASVRSQIATLRSQLTST